MSYSQMSNVSAHAAGIQGKRENFAMRQGPMIEASCHFPAPAPFRTYCQPAAFHSSFGERYPRLIDAYGQSRPSMCGR